MMLRYALVGLSAAVIVGVTFIPEDVLAARYSGARTAHYHAGTAGRHVAYRATGVAGRGYRAAAYRGAAYRGYGYRGAYGAAVGAAAVGAAAAGAYGYYNGYYGGYNNGCYQNAYGSLVCPQY